MSEIYSHVSFVIRSPIGVKNRNHLSFASCRWLVLLSALAFWGGINPAWGALPSGWSDADIGSPALAGSASYTNGIWTVSGGGTDIGNTNDQFNFCSNSLSGDGVIMARVLAQTGSDAQAQAGVMIRNDDSAASAHAAVLITPGDGVIFRYRTIAAGTTSQTLITNVTAPVWVRLSCSGDTFTATYSIDGISWTQIGSPQTISMGSTALAGLAVTAHNDSLINTAMVNNVLIVPGSQAGVPAGLINPYTGQVPLAWETTWPLPQIDNAGNAPTPRMGWNSWFVVGDATGPSESLIESTADALVTNGLAAAGYKYVVIDCSWISPNRGSRDANGNLIVDPTRWPDGMKGVADYVHSKGLLMGGYTDIGALGYGSPAQIGSFAYYQQDADQFANWGWDFIKIDDHGPGDFYAAAYAMTHNSSGRPIVVSFSTPQVDRLLFAPRIANSWRVANDISFTFGSVTWGGILTEFNVDEDDWYAQAPGRWNDPDMLTTGLNGITDMEGRSQFNMWAILGAPLMIGTDVRTTGGAYPPPLSAATLATLTNAEVITVDQDPLGTVGRLVAPNVYAKPLGSFASGQYAVLLLNRSTSPATITANWSDLGLVANSSASVRDLWAHQDLGLFTGSYTSPGIPSHDSMMLKVTGTFDWNRSCTYEAESGYNTLSGTAYCVPHNSNFSAGAYITGVGLGPANTLQFNRVAVPSNGLYEVDVYYACSVSRTAQLSVNGGSTTNVSFPATGSDTNPGVMATYLQLNVGENIVNFSNPTDVAPNFDKIIVSGGAPPSLSAIGGDGQVQLTWTTLAGTVSYNVYRGIASGGESATPIASGLTTLAYTDTAVTNGQTYYYTVTAVNPTLGGESPPSTEASARPRFATSSTAYQTAILADQPVAYWRLNETNGTTAYDQMGKHQGTYASAVVLGGAGPRPPDFLGFELTNTAAQFTQNLTNSWVYISSAWLLNGNTVTIIAWIYPTGSQADAAGLFVYSRAANTTVAGLNYGSVSSGNAQTLGYTWNNDSRTWGWDSGLMPPVNQWSFVALVVQPASATLYLINTHGEQSATHILSHNNAAIGDFSYIGTDPYAKTARVFNGLIDEVAVFNYSLTPAQIQQLYANGAVLPQVQVGIQYSGPNLDLSWPQGTLLQAENLMGPWLPVPNALSPYSVSVTPTNTSMFYRVLLQQ
jgi:alpha-galactosidase